MFDSVAPLPSPARAQNAVELALPGAIDLTIGKSNLRHPKHFPRLCERMTTGLGAVADQLDSVLLALFVDTVKADIGECRGRYQ